MQTYNATIPFAQVGVPPESPKSASSNYLISLVGRPHAGTQKRSMIAMNGVLDLIEASSVPCTHHDFNDRLASPCLSCERIILAFAFSSGRTVWEIFPCLDFNGKSRRDV